MPDMLRIFGIFVFAVALLLSDCSGSLLPGCTISSATISSLKIGLSPDSKCQVNALSSLVLKDGLGVTLLNITYCSCSGKVTPVSVTEYCKSGNNPVLCLTLSLLPQCVINKQLYRCQAVETTTTTSTERSTSRSTASTQPTEPSTYSTQPTEPSVHSTQPTEPSTHSTQTEPSTLSTQTEPSTHSTQTEPSTHSTQPTEPSTHSTQTEPSTHSTQTEPSTHSTQPTESTTASTPSDPRTPQNGGY